VTDEPASTLARFDLHASWVASQRDFAALRPCPNLTVELLVQPPAWPRLRAGLGAWWPLADLGVETDGRC